ncbi:MAG: MarC family protein [Candidatus Eremiobacteraeota bacterium]|nr:MarC family protein [Candidatus Eremiobacteraeota bacterium]
MHLTLSAVREFAGGSLVHGFLFVALALFPIVNPIGMAPIFLQYTGDLEDLVAKRLARRVAINSFILAVAALIIGPYVLKFFGLSLPAVQIAGALVIAFAGWRLLNQDQAEGERRAADVSPESLLRGAFYPLTLPFTIGPGSIAVLVALGGDLPYVSAAPSELLETVGEVVAIAAVCLTVYICYSRAELIFKRLGPTGVNVLLRLSAFILLCIGVQIAIEGFRGLSPR